MSGVLGEGVAEDAAYRIDDTTRVVSLLAARLERECGPQVEFLRSRRLGRDRRAGDIELIAIAPSGVYLIDAKDFPGMKVRADRRGGILDEATEHLMIDGCDRTQLLDDCDNQVDAVVAALADHPLGASVPVTAVVCFVDAQLPKLGKLYVHGVRLVGPKGAVKMLRSDGPLDVEARTSLHAHLGFMLPPA